ncbi:MAG TPA: hypothetical protein VFI74_01355 [Candidatus Saccharimonadales bacterium]|nr:hypothetical protein [Candidatus Saccharimonadales bacterium]
MFGINDEKYEELRRILEKQNGHSYTLEEVKKIGSSLIDFFYLLIELSDQEES